MPYIKPERRPIFQQHSEDLGSVADNAGELNFVFSKVADGYLGANGLNYQHINDIIGALEGAKLELYRRVASDYEDTKIFENGDVYTCLESK